MDEMYQDELIQEKNFLSLRRPGRCGILTSEGSDRGHNLIKPLNESSIKVGKTKKTLDALQSAG